MALAYRGLRAANMPLARGLARQRLLRQAVKPLAGTTVRYLTADMVHFKLTPNKHPLEVVKASVEWKNPTPHAVWTEEETHSVMVNHMEPVTTSDKVVLGMVKTLRFTFDLLAGFKSGPINEDKYLNRMIFLETVAAVPGMVAAMVRHLRSLRNMKRDHGWIHTLLEEAENERMHLLTFLKLKQPGPLFRVAVLITQGVFFNLFFLAYLISPKSCHRLVGYVEEEAVHTYTSVLEGIDTGKFPLFTDLKAPLIGTIYWKLGEDASFRDLILAIRADEANHRLVNHTFADLYDQKEASPMNPFLPSDNIVQVPPGKN